MRRLFRECLETLQELSVALGLVATMLQAQVEQMDDAGPLKERLEELELSRSKWEAEIEAELLRAGSKLKAANNAEARERSLKASYARLSEGDDEGGGGIEEAAAAWQFQQANEGTGNEEGVLEVHPGLGHNPKAAAVRAKYGAS